ncbi:MAG: hypothetical protein LBS84_09045 [Clostridiales bacterium]|nr:hypothetical protein [Clostridiales bacterium]
MRLITSYDDLIVPDKHKKFLKDYLNQISNYFHQNTEKNGWWLARDKGPHSIYTNGLVSESVPRHTELKETLVKAIMKRRGLT